MIEKTLFAPMQSSDSAVNVAIPGRTLIQCRLAYHCPIASSGGAMMLIASLASNGNFTFGDPKIESMGDVLPTLIRIVESARHETVAPTLVS